MLGHRAEALFSPWEQSKACLGVREARLWLDDACLTRCLGLGPVVCEALHAGPLVRRRHTEASVSAEAVLLLL